MPPATTVATPIAHLVGPGKLRVINGRLAFSTAAGQPLRLDLRRLNEVYCYGKVTLTDEALRLLAAHHVEVALLSYHGLRCRGRLVQQTSSSTALRLIQYHLLHHPPARLALARQLVQQKITSQQQAARHYQRQGQKMAGPVRRQLGELLRRAEQAETLDQLRGLEGAASAAWFGLLAQLLRPGAGFPGRQRRPPRDPVNALLSLGYTLLLNRLIARIQARGLEPNLGALHDYAPGRPSLACDLIEPWRVPLVDRWVVAQWNQGAFAPEHFRHDPQHGVRLQEKHFPRALTNWEQFLQDKKSDTSLQNTIDQFCRRLREMAQLLPQPESAPSG